MLRKLLLFLCALWCCAGAQALRPVAADSAACTQVALETSMGTVRLRLYNDTPLHRDNFVRLVRQGFYDGLLFHRVIPQFMVQAGDSASRHAAPGQLLGSSPEGYTVPAEIRWPRHYHRRGVLAAAREGDEANPERASSASQFYIVTGRPYTDTMLDQVQERVDARTAGQVKFTPEQREVYFNEGGAPHLDGQYTIFGEVVEGMEVIDAMQWVECDENDRPLTDVRIVRATVLP